MTNPNPAKSQEPKADLRAAGKSIAAWLISRRTAATFLSSFAVVGIFTVAIGNYFSHLTNQRIISQQTSKLLINKGLLVAEVDNAHGDLNFVGRTLFGARGQNNLFPFEIYQQNKDYLSNFINSQRSYLSLAWRETPIARKGQLQRGQGPERQTNQGAREQDQSRLTVFHPVDTADNHQQSAGLELSLSIAKILNPPSSELPYKKPRCFLILDQQGHTRYDSLTIHNGHDENHPTLSSSNQDTKEVAERIHQTAEGSFKDHSGSWQWATIELNAGIDGVHAADNHWKLVSHVPPIIFKNATRGHLLPLGIGSLVIFGLIITPLSFFSNFISTKRKKLIAQHAWEASHDSLTGCINRGSGLEILQRQSIESNSPDQINALLFIDVDHLSQINNSYGHAIGDQALIKICKSIRKSIRNNDTLIRMGGDEFIVSLSNIGSTKNAENVADKILKSCNATLPLDKTIVPVSVSIGIAVTSPNSGISHRKIIEAADLAMLDAKQQGRNQITLIDLKINETKDSGASSSLQDIQKPRQNPLSKELEQALKENSLSLCYQPIFSKDKTMVGAEALLRLRTTDNRSVSPAVFIPIAEQNGFMPAIGSWVVQTAFEQVRQWRAEGLTPPVISINLSTTQLDDETINDKHQITQIASTCLASKKLSPTHFKFEITETTTLSNQADALTELRDLSSMGFKISIDDFGAGFASLERLRGFPADQIKLDKEFTKNVVHSDIDSSLVKAITHLAKDLKMELVAEGVENLEQFHRLRDLGCDLFQGYLFEKPISATQFADKYLRPMQGESNA